MLIHSIAPIENLLPQQKLQKPDTLEIGGGFLEGERQKDGSIKIGRVISTNPGDYLNPSYNLGSSYNSPPQAVNKSSSKK